MDIAVYGFFPSGELNLALAETSLSVGLGVVDEKVLIADSFTNGNSGFDSL
jgi:hypothetical protein